VPVNISLQNPAVIDWPTHRFSVIATTNKVDGPFAGWTRYSKDTKGKVEGNIAKFTVVESGLVGVWALFYRANDHKYSGGAWVKECWTREDFVKNGWEKIATDGHNTDWYVRDCKKGEKWKIRCSKYSGIFIFAAPRTALLLPTSIEDDYFPLSDLKRATLISSRSFINFRN
jgi:hypothetical protein